MATINNTEAVALMVGDYHSEAPFLQMRQQLGVLRGINLLATIVVSGSDPVWGQLWPIGTRQS